VEDAEAKYWRERLGRFIRSQVSDHGRPRVAASGDQGQSGVGGGLIGSDGIQPRGELSQDEKGDGGGDANVSDKPPDGV